MTEVLRLDGVSRTFGGVTALRGVSFGVRTGEILGLIGPNGAGKTTAFNVISGVLRPTSGRVRFKNDDITGLPPHRIVRLGLARTFQATTVFSHATVLENVLRGAFVRTPRWFLDGLVGGRRTRAALAGARADAERLLETMGLLDLADSRAGSLSYGHQKRLGVAVALATGPELLLLDEPVAGLNPEESAEFGRLIRRIRSERGLSILLVEHHMRLMMELCDRIVVLDHGQRIAEGTPEEIRRDPVVIEAYLGSGDAACS